MTRKGIPRPPSLEPDQTAHEGDVYRPLHPWQSNVRFVKAMRDAIDKGAEKDVEVPLRNVT